MAETYKICCLTYRQLDTLVKSALDKIQDEELEFHIVEGLQADVVDMVNQKIAHGIDVVVGGGANAAAVREACDIPVLDYKLTPYDYLNAIDNAFSQSSHIAIVTYEQPLNPDLAKYIDHIGASLTNVIYNDPDELENLLATCDCDVFIGGAHSAEIAEQLGKKHILIYPGEQSIISAVFEAKALAKEIRKNNESAKFSRAIINYSTNGIVILDTSLSIIDYNSAAQQILPISLLEHGKSVETLLPFCNVGEFIANQADSRSDIIRVSEREIYQSWIRLSSDAGAFMGAVGIFQLLSDISRIELEYTLNHRQMLAQKGFTAKHIWSDILGNSPAIKSCISEARKYAKTHSNVLLYGETGVGKELFAQSIHNLSERRKGPFVAINCAALPETLLESELFGYDDGAFTGSRKSGKKGLFELANGGTMLLDEIGDISPMMQTRLLRVLQEREIMHVGDDRVIPVDVRIVAATHRDLEALDHNSFRKDLLYRLNVLELHIPALREREGDIPLLFDHFFKSHSNLERHQIQFPQVIYDVLNEYSFRGNIRELQNVCERFSLYLAGDGGEKHMRHCIIKAIGEERLFRDLAKKYNDKHNRPTEQMVDAVNRYFPYSQEKISELLGISRTSLWRIKSAQLEKGKQDE